MIDIHTHFLAACDDGPNELSSSIRMLKISILEGVDNVILTPHFKRDIYPLMDIEHAFELLKEEVKIQKLNINLHLGSELYLDENLLSSLVNGQCRTLAKSKYVLIELPFQKIYPFHEEYLYSIHLAGYEIILAHVERYPYLLENDSLLLKKFRKMGYYMQMNASYIVKKSTRKRAVDLIRHNFIHIIASDCHSELKRPPMLKNANKIVARKVGKSSAELLFELNPANVISNISIVRECNDKYEKKSIFYKILNRTGKRNL